jgi:MFS transporter, DHA2 family, multidrug resistance protein
MWARNPQVAGLHAVLCVAALALLVLDQSRSRLKMLNFRLLRYSGVLAASTLGLSYGIGLYGSTYLLPMYIQDLGGRASWVAGTAMLPGGLALAFTLHAGGWLTDRFAVRPILLGALLVFMASNIAFLFALTPVSLGLFVVLTTIGRGATGVMIPGLNAGATRAAPEAHAATITVLVNYFRTLGGMVGVGVVGLLLELGSEGQQRAASADAYSHAFVALALCFAPALAAVYWMRPNGTTAQ